MIGFHLNAYHTATFFSQLVQMIRNSMFVFAPEKKKCPVVNPQSTANMTPFNFKYKVWSPQNAGAVRKG